MVDYAKWDKFASALSDSDSDNDVGNAPKVTKLSGSGGSVTIGPKGAQIIEKPFREPAPSNASSASMSGVTSSGMSSASGSISDPTADNVLKWTINGFAEENYFWSQDRTEVTLFIKIDGAAKAKEVAVTLESPRQLVVFWRSGVIFSGLFQYDVITPDDGDQSIDWEFASESYHGMRLIQIVLLKKSPIAGATIWWKNAFAGGREVDLSSLQGRDSRNMIGSNLWKDAHAMFVERVKDIKPTVISTDDS